MRAHIVSLIFGLFAALASFSLWAYNTCPGVDDISRISGEYGWITTVPGWEGGYVYPRQARGHSTEVTHFIETRWIQLSNLADSQGYFECDYQGNYEGEIIRFTQAGTRANQKPEGDMWACHLNPDFPGVQCSCSGTPELCVLVTLETDLMSPIIVSRDLSPDFFPDEADQVMMDK